MELVNRGDRGRFLIGFNSRLWLSDVIGRNKCRGQLLPRGNKFRLVRNDEVESYKGVGTLNSLFAFQLFYRLLQQLAIQVKPDIDDVATLGGAKNVAGSPNFQVPHRDLKACP